LGGIARRIDKTEEEARMSFQRFRSLLDTSNLRYWPTACNRRVFYSFSRWLPVGVHGK
jgi:hypothetical protein